MSSLTQKAVSGVRWSALSQLGRQAIGFITTALLARLLEPSDFGIMSMVFVVSGFVSVFRDLGTSAAVIQKKELSSELISSIFWFNVFVGLFVTLILIIMSPLAGSYFKEPKVALLLCGLSPAFVLSSLSIVQQSLLQREMDFNSLARVELVSTVISATTGVVAALNGLGVWSLVFQAIALELSTTIGLWLASSWRPSWGYCINETKSIISFSGYLMLFTTFNYFARNSDNMLIGRYLGSVTLGYYALAYRMMQFPLQTISALYGRVLLPAFSKIQDNNEAFRNAYLRSMGFIAIITFPMMLGLCVLAKPFITVLLSDKWLPIVPALQVLSIVGMNQSLATTVGNIYIAKAQTRIMFYVGVVSSFCYVLAIIIGLQWGLMGVVICYAVADFVLTPPNYLFSFRFIELPVLRLIEPTWRPLICSLVMALFLWSLSDVILLFTSKIIGFFLLVFLGVSIYLIMSWFVNRTQLQKFVQIAMKRS